MYLLHRSPIPSNASTCRMGKRQDNSRLQISVKMRTQNATYPVFKVAADVVSMIFFLLAALELRHPWCSMLLGAGAII
uniref:7TM_GPCR_Srx domain-containing protein n=1 Tax=Steinernema glaseri TaxID=37863 RepID=A0A1I7YDX2_9BILA